MICRIGCSLIIRNYSLLLQLSPSAIETQITDSRHLLFAIRMVGFEEKGQTVAVVKQRALDWYLDNLTGEGELESLRCWEI